MWFEGFVLLFLQPHAVIIYPCDESKLTRKPKNQLEMIEEILNLCLLLPRELCRGNEDQSFIGRRYVEAANWLKCEFQAPANGIADEFLHSAFHGSGTQRSMNATPQEVLEGFFGNG
jgi:hypothetical protein